MWYIYCGLVFSGLTLSLFLSMLLTSVYHKAKCWVNDERFRDPIFEYEHVNILGIHRVDKDDMAFVVASCVLTGIVTWPLILLIAISAGIMHLIRAKKRLNKKLAELNIKEG